MSSSSSEPKLFVKVFKEGNFIGRKVDLLRFSNYESLVATLSDMFNVTITYGDDENNSVSRNEHTLTYLDKEGDWIMAGDLPWNNFLSTVKRLEIKKPKTP